MDIEKLISTLSKDVIKKLKVIKMPIWVDPMLAILTKDYFSSDSFLYEHKWDGERIIAYKDGDKVSLMTRNKKLANANYPGLVKDLKNQKIEKFIIDGEIIAEKNNKSDFSILQKKMHSSDKNQNINAKIYYYVFDIIYLEKYDLRDLELISRKLLLKNSINFTDEIKFTDYYMGDGIARFKKACKLGWEGLIVKNIHSKYLGKRTKDWLKFKCVDQQEFVIGGYTDPKHSRAGFGALLVGYYDDNHNLIYVGKVGTGFDVETLKDLKNQFLHITQNKCPFSNIEDIAHNKKDINWLKPKMVAEIKFAQWTAYNKLRHSRFMGLRLDKNAKDVVKEMPKNMINR